MIDPFAITAPAAARLLRLALTPSAPVSLVGEQIGRYSVRAELGQGGTATVYVAFDPKLKREVALKVLSANVKAPDWLRREGEHQASVAHPNIVAVHDFGDHDGLHYLAMELVDGDPLQTPAASPHRAAEIALDIAEAVHFAHQRQIIHCDLKPANVLIERHTGRARVSDFGHAIRIDLASQAKPLGTPVYQAPEVWWEEPGQRDAVVSVLIDVWSVGVVLHEMLSGRPPFAAETMEELKRKVLEDPPPPLPGVHPDLAAVCRRCMDKDPSRRYASAAHLADDLRAFLDGREVRARPLDRAERWRRRLARHRLAALASATAAAGVTFGVASFVYGNVQAARAAQAREQVAQAHAQVAERELTMIGMVAAETMAREVSGIFDQFSDAVRQAGQRHDLVTAATERSQRKAIEACTALQALPVTRRPGFTDWLLFDGDGNLLGRAPMGLKDNLGRDYPWRDYFKGALHERRPHVSRVYRSEADGKAEVGVAVALRDERDAVVGVLVAEISPDDALQRLLSEDAEARGVSITMLARGDRDRDRDSTPVFILHPDRKRGEPAPASADTLLGEGGSPKYDRPVRGTPFTVRVQVQPPQRE
jgi:hypothetical protein